MTPEELDRLWSRLIDSETSYELPLNISHLVTDAYNRWADWFGGPNYGEWPLSEMPFYERLYTQTNNTLNAAISQAGNIARVYNTPTTGGPVVELAPVSIWGRITKAQKKKLGIAAGLAAVLGIIAASKVKT